MKLIPLRKRNGEIRAYAKVDDAMYEHISKWKWCQNGKGMVNRTDYSSNKKSIYLHRFVIGFYTGNKYDELEGDFIDRDYLNCQISNLRVATHSENQYYAKSRSKNGMKGVFYQKVKVISKGKEYFYDKWTANLYCGKKRIQKRFNTKSEAVKWRDKNAKIYHGEFANLNFK